MTFAALCGAPRNSFDWFFLCRAAGRPDYEADGFATREEAQTAAEAYAMKVHGPAPGYAVRLHVGSPDLISTLWLDWPPPK